MGKSKQNPRAYNVRDRMAERMQRIKRMGTDFQLDVGPNWFSYVLPRSPRYLWAEHRELDNTKDTVTGSYTLEANASTMQIQWHNVASPHGMTKGTSYSVNFLQDSLSLTRLVEGFDYEVKVKAVHN